MLAGVLALSEVQVNALYFLRRRLGRTWFHKLLSDEEADHEELDAYVRDGELIKGTLGAIQRKFELFRSMGFLQPKVNEDLVEGELKVDPHGSITSSRNSVDFFTWSM